MTPTKNINRSSCPKVALLFETPNAYSRRVLLGIGEYIASHEPWQVNLAHFGFDDRPPAWLASWDGQGIFLRGVNRRMAETVENLSLPVVDLTPSRLLPKAPWVKTDDAAVARLAAQHFFDRGFRQFAFCGNALSKVSKWRQEYFKICVVEAGHACHLFEERGQASSSDAETEAIARWLAKLPKPIGVFASNDGIGQHVLDACRRAGLAVPEEVAVLGVDNDEVLCALSPPPMSSVILNPQRVGWQAAELLDSMMRGKTVPIRNYFIPPIDIAVRQSTDVLAVNDPQIAKALRFIRDNACEHIGVKQVLQQCPMSRRAMETRFRRLLGRTPRQEIVRVQVSRVKELLVGTALPVSEIGERTGFEPEYISAVFKQETGMTPSEFRRQFGARG